jgi:hypothetical protein
MDAKGQERGECEEKSRALHQKMNALHDRMKALHAQMEADHPGERHQRWKEHHEAIESAPMGEPTGQTTPPVAAPSTQH